MHRAAKRPWPQLSDDPVIDYLIMEALATKDAKEEEKQRKEMEKKKWQADKSDLWKAVGQ